MRFTVEEEKAILERSGLLSILTLDMLDELRERYADPRRHYHVWDHALQVLSWVNYVCEDVSPWTEQQVAASSMDLKVAALFHDVVYDASKGAPHNETASVEVMRSLGIQRPGAEEVVMATARHGKTAPNELPLPIALFLDCDIAHFGERRWEVVLWNDNNVTREYEHHFPKEAVAEGRKKFLEGMLAGDRHIFMSSHFRDLYEQQARKNLQRLIREAA